MLNARQRTTRAVATQDLPQPYAQTVLAQAIIALLMLILRHESEVRTNGHTYLGAFSWKKGRKDELRDGLKATSMVNKHALT